MKTKLLIYLILGLLVGSCNNSTDQSTEESTKSNEKNPAVSCYRYITATDTINLKLTQIGQSVTGTLVYQLSGKDRNVGTIQGEINGDLLVADYHFLSEGTNSTRQVAFKKIDNYFIEGYGEVTTTDARISFKNLDSLQFNESFKLKEFDCAK